MPIVSLKKVCDSYVEYHRYMNEERENIKDYFEYLGQHCDYEN